MKITAHQYADGTRYYMAFGYFGGRPILVEAMNRLDAIIGWINTANEAKHAR
jgi:hypothetical protein